MASKVIKLQNDTHTLLPVTDSKYVQYYNGTSYESTKTALDNRIKKVTSTDNAVVRFDGTGGNVQNSGVTITDTNQIIPETIGFKPKSRNFNGSGWYRIFTGSMSPIHLMLTRNYNSPSPEGYDIDIETFDITVTDDLWGIATITQNAGYFGTGSEANQEIQKIRVYGYNGAPSSNPNNTDKSKLCIDVYIDDKSTKYANTYYISGYSLGTANDFKNYAELTADNLEYVEFCQGKNSTRYYSEFVLVDGFKTNKKAIAQSFVKDGGTSSQFLKADGSVDSNVYATTSSVDTLLSSYVKKSGDTMTGALVVPTASSATDETKGINFGTSSSTGAHIGYSTLLGIYSDNAIYMRPNGASTSSTGNGSIEVTNNGINVFEVVTAEGFKKTNGTSSQFLKADGSVDSNEYVTTNSYSSEQISIPSSVTLSNHIRYVQGQEIDFDENFANTVLGTSTTVTPSATLNNTNTSHKYWYNA